MTFWVCDQCDGEKSWFNCEVFLKLCCSFLLFWNYLNHVSKLNTFLTITMFVGSFIHFARYDFLKSTSPVFMKFCTGVHRLHQISRLNL